MYKWNVQMEVFIIIARKNKSQNWLGRLTANVILRITKSLYVMEIFIEASLNRDCRNTRRANICLHSRMLRSSWNFQGASTFAGATWLPIYRSRVRVSCHVCVSSLQTFNVPCWQDQPAMKSVHQSSLHYYNHFQPAENIFHPLSSISFAVNWYMRELVYVIFE